MADSKVTDVKVLTKDEIEKVKVGICPKCQEELTLDVIVKSDGSTLYDYDKKLGQWVAYDPELEHELLSLCCTNYACDFSADGSYIDEDDIERLG